MIFLDVTNSARQRVQTGIQRVVRSIHHHLAAGQRVTPLVWSSPFSRYSPLQREQRRNLVDPFRGGAFSSTRPDLLVNPYPWSKTQRWLHQKFHQIDLPARVAPGDLFFVPEIFQDHRIEYFQEILPLKPGSGRSWALFYDALVWSLRGYNPADRNPRFEAYMAVLARFDGVVCISRESEDDLRRFWSEHGIAPAPTHTLHLPMPLVEVRPVAAPSWANRRVLMVATLEPRKNHLRLLEACEMLWSRGLRFELEVIGRSVGEGSVPMERKIAELQAAGRPLQWLAHIDDGALTEAYRRCSFTVYPSIREGFGLPILESLWHGRPCVCGENGALGEVARGGGCQFVDQTDPASIAGAMENLLTDEAQYGITFRAAQARAFRSWDDYVHDLLGLMAGLKP